MTTSGIQTRFLIRNGYPKPGDLRKGKSKTEPKGDEIPEDQKPRGLHVHAATVDLQLKEQVKRLASALERAQKKAEEASSPLEREKWKKTAYELNETLGAIRFSPVTGTDSSDLEKPK